MYVEHFQTEMRWDFKRLPKSSRIDGNDLLLLGERGIKGFLDTAPSIMQVIRLHFFTFNHGPFRQCHHQTGFKHERLCFIGDTDRIQFTMGCLLKRSGIRPMRCHHGMQRCPTRNEAALFGFVFAFNETHEFWGDITVIIRGSECPILNSPSRRENGEIHDSHSGNWGFAGENGENGRIAVIEWSRIDDIESVQVVFVRVVIAMPSDHIVRRMILCHENHSSTVFFKGWNSSYLLCNKQASLEFTHNLEWNIKFLKPCFWSKKVTRIRQSIRPNGTQIRNFESPIVHFHHISA